MRGIMSEYGEAPGGRGEKERERERKGQSHQHNLVLNVGLLTVSNNNCITRLDFIVFNSIVFRGDYFQLDI